MAKIDTHVHFWQLARGDYDWLSPDKHILYRDYGIEDFEAAKAKTEITKCIAVQAAPTLAETQFLLDLAKTYDAIIGVTGWVDLLAENVSAQLDILKHDKKTVGIRPMIGIEQGAEWLSSPKFSNGLAALAQSGLVLEALVLPHHLPGIANVAQRSPELKIIINHAAKPKPADLGQWDKDISQFKELENVTCKFSGLPQQCSEPDHYRHVFATLMNTFGPQRMMWGSDYPVLLETSTYAKWTEYSDTLLSELSQSERSSIETDTALKTYDIDLG